MRFTRRFLTDASSEVYQILSSHKGSHNTRPEDVAIVALGPQKLQTDDIGLHFLGELVAGSIGVDRMDYLGHDSLHTGVAYGRFDHQRLLYTLTLGEAPNTLAPTLAVEEGGLQTLEGLLLARYFMFQQMYYHDVRAVTYESFSRPYCVKDTYQNRWKTICSGMIRAWKRRFGRRSSMKLTLGTTQLSHLLADGTSGWQVS